MQTNIFFVVAPASFAQLGLLLDPRCLLHGDKSIVANHNMPFLYHLYSTKTLSITQLRQALQQILVKHKSLRTSLVGIQENNLLMQKIIDLADNYNSVFGFIESSFETEEQLNNTIRDEQYNLQLFDLAQGLVFRCHIVYYKQISSNNFLTDKDVLIFNFHHVSFDRPSMDVFLSDLNQAYITGLLSNDDDILLRYLDCKYKSLFLIIIYHLFLSFR